MMSNFTHLHSHGENSVADGLFSSRKWAEAYKERGFKAAALTDHGTLAGLLPFYYHMKDAGLIPIMGTEAYYVDNPLDKTMENRKSNHLVLIAKDYDGFRNLLQLTRLSYTEGFYFRPRIGIEWLRQYHEGLICLSACQGGVLSAEVWKEEAGEPQLGLEGKFDEFHSIFGDDFYVEFQGHAQEGQEKVNRAFYDRLRGRKGFQHVATNDNHYVLPEHAKIQTLLKDIAYKTKNTDAGQSYTSCDSLWLKSPSDIWDTFRRDHGYLPDKFITEGMANTEAILEKVANFEMPEGKRYLPRFRKKYDSASVFRTITTKALKDFLDTGKLHATRAEYVERFKKEYGVISRYHLEDYFLIVWDLVRFSKSKGIYVGIGRGSSAGCLISFLLGIVRIDPLRYGLIFERFLNEHRCKEGELADIDLDLESDRRDEVKDYIFKTYGREKVCEIGTYGRMQLKTSLIDFGKALGVVTQKEILAITTKLDLDKHDKDSLEAAIDASPKLKGYMVKNHFYAFAVEEIIGQIKNQSIHPAGIVICSDPIHEITPIKTQKDRSSKDAERVITTQAEDKYILRQGLMKMDILGLKEYDIVKYVIENSGIDLNVNNYVEKIVELEDSGKNENVWERFREGDTVAIFQFASDGMQDLLRMMQPDCIEDLMAANALYRPGCLENGWHILYCDRKHGRKPVEYPHEDLKESLKDTYGIMVYQEQVMEAIHKLGGISLVDSDTIRSALGKKDEAKLNKFRARFIRGAAKKMGEEPAKKLWSQIQKSSGYSFNKSHSAVYSILAYISQYLKVNCPIHFWAAHLEWDTRKNKKDEMLRHKKAAGEMGIRHQLPHVNESRGVFRVHKGLVVWSFQSVKGLGAKAAREIERHQPYADFEDFFHRVNKSKVKFNNIEGLIYSGVFDSMGDRKALIKLLYSKKKDKKPPALTDDHLMMQFYEMMGFFEQKIKDVRPGFTDCVDQGALEGMVPGEPAKVGGILAEVRRIKTKNGDPMGFGILVDLDEVIELTFFPKTWAKFRPILTTGRVVQVSGVKSEYNGKANLLEAEIVEEV